MPDSQDFEDQLQQALVTRPVIEQAKGVLVGVRCATPEQAFEELRFAAQRHDVQLNDLAAALVEASSGGKPEDPLLRKIIWQEWSEVIPNC